MNAGYFGLWGATQKAVQPGASGDALPCTPELSRSASLSETLV